MAQRYSHEEIMAMSPEDKEALKQELLAEKERMSQAPSYAQPRPTLGQTLGKALLLGTQAYTTGKIPDEAFKSETVSTEPDWYTKQRFEQEQRINLEKEKERLAEERRQKAFAGVEGRAVRPKGLTASGEVTYEFDPTADEAAQKDLERQMKVGSELRKEFNASKVMQDYQTVDRGYRALEDAFRLSTSPDVKSRIASDQALGVLFQKLLDPQSVVRESEYARTPEGAALLNRIASIGPQLTKGGLRLADSDRRSLVESAEKLLESSQKSLEGHISRYTEIAKSYNVDPKYILGGIETRFTKPSLGSDGDKNTPAVGGMLNGEKIISVEPI